MADNANNNISSQAAIQSMAAQMTSHSSIFSGNDSKRMSFDGNMPQFGYSESPRSFNLTAGLLGDTQNYNRDRRDSLKNLVHLDDFGTD